jgi:hypothetical protein
MGVAVLMQHYGTHVFVSFPSVHTVITILNYDT